MSRISQLAQSFRGRLVVGYVLVIAIFAVAWLWSLYTPLTRAVVEQQERNLASVAYAGAELAAESEAAPQAIAERLVGESDLRVTIVAEDGVVLADSSSDPGAMGNHAERPEVAAALGGRLGSERRLSATEGREQLYVAVPAVLAGQDVALRASQPLSGVFRVAETVQRVGVILIPLSIVAAVAIATWASRAATVPVERLSASARLMADGNLGAPLPPVPTDLQTLSDALDSLRGEVRVRLDDLAAERETLRLVLDGLGDAVFLVETGRIAYANEAASRIFRAPPSGWRDKPFDEAGLPAALASAVSGSVASGEPVSTELSTDPTGQTLRVSTVPLPEPEHAGRILVVVQNVTERARLDRVRRDFVANASHELKTPVVGIRLLADSAKTAADDGDSEQALDFARRIAAEADRLERLVVDLLDLSRLEAAPADANVVGVRVALQNTVVGHSASATRKGLSLDLDLTGIEGLDVYVRSDPTDLAVALDNLLANAVAYTASGGVTVSAAADDETVHISVCDTGVGIPDEDLPRIFERFYRVDRARSRENGSTGLGLALVRHVVERSHGTIDVESALGAGSTFTMHLPRAV
jgi:two-component system phosphate regulon sensor histidine kinase PhoR